MPNNKNLAVIMLSYNYYLVINTKSRRCAFNSPVLSQGRILLTMVEQKGFDNSPAYVHRASVRSGVYRLNCALDNPVILKVAYVLEVNLGHLNLTRSSK